jgi:serine/threonine-protein kinase
MPSPSSDPNVTGAYDPPPAAKRFAPGTLLAGRYRLVAAAGRGGMGEVYRADDLTLGQPVALKFLPPHLADDPDRLARFRKEVAVARRVSHPNVCRVHDLAEADGQPFLTMEYVDGEDLASLLRRIGRVPEDKAIAIARELCWGLAAVHEQGLVYRDLKPANVMLDGRGKVRLTDFGLAAAAEDLSAAELRAGTPAYMAPEQLAGNAVTARSDLFALGLVLYELFTGKKAFTGLDRDTPPNTPSSHLSGLDPAVERVILRCVQRDPKDRPASALAVAAALPGSDAQAAALAAGETPWPQRNAPTDSPENALAAHQEALQSALAAVLRAEQEEREAEAAMRAVRDQYEPVLRRSRQAQADAWEVIARLLAQTGAAEVVVPGEHCDYKIALSSAPEKVDVPDPSAVPEEFLKKEPKRKEILDYLKKLREAGAPLPGWATITRGPGSLCYKPVKKA